jgi:hypothetical protein
VTERCGDATRRARRLGIKDVGEAKAPASELLPRGRNHSGAGAAPSLRVARLALLAVGTIVAVSACTGDRHEATHAGDAATAALRAAADPAAGQTTALDGVAPAFGEGLVAELTGDAATARAQLARVLDATDVPPAFAARAALRLAQLEARAGHTERARDLSVRAQALAPADGEIEAGAADIRADIVAMASSGEIRGPALGTALPGVEPALAEAFTRAERALARVHGMRPRQRLEVWEKEDATEDAVTRYRAIAEHGGLAALAADYRIGSLYHDLAVGLRFELPPGLTENAASELRLTLRTRALAYLRRAETAYQECLALPPSADGEIWRLAAETSLRAARDLLGE